VAEAELDYQEGIDLWRAGDPEEARDALRYALGACRDNLWVHVALGQLALREFKDPALARGHFGYAVELGTKALPPGFSGRLPRERVANRPFFEAIEGLAEALRAIGKAKDADGLSAFAERLGALGRGNALEPARRRPHGRVLPRRSLIRPHQRREATA